MVPIDRRHGLEEGRRRWGERLDTYLEAVHRGDPLADALVSHDRASALATLAAGVPPRPAWLDDQTLVRGGDLLHRGGALSMIALAASSLVQGYAAPAANKPLVLSGQLERRAYRRLQETARFVLAGCAPGAMAPGGPGIGTTLQVRLVHAQVRRMIRRSGRWRPDRWGEPLNQHDLVGTLMMFTVVVLEALDAMGMPPGRDEAERYYRLWRWIAIVLGIEPALVPVDVAAARDVTAMMRATQPPPDDDARALTRALHDSPVREARTRGERALGHFFRHVLIAGAWQLLPDGMAAALATPRPALPLAAVRPLARAWSLVPRALTVRLGRRSWERMVAYDPDAAFPLPDQLLGRAPRPA